MFTVDAGALVADAGASGADAGPVAGLELGLEAATGSSDSRCGAPPGSTGCDGSPTVADEGSVSKSITGFFGANSVCELVARGSTGPPVGVAVVVCDEEAGAIAAALGPAAPPSEIGNPGAWSAVLRLMGPSEAGAAGLASNVCGSVEPDTAVVDAVVLPAAAGSGADE